MADADIPFPSTLKTFMHGDLYAQVKSAKKIPPKQAHTFMLSRGNEFQYPIPLMSKFPVLSISLFSAESGHNSCRKVPCFTNKVLEWYKHVFQTHNIPWFSVFTWWQDQSYSSANYVHCSAKLSVNSQLFYLLPCLFRGWASDFFSWGSSLE